MSDQTGYEQPAEEAVEGGDGPSGEQPEARARPPRGARLLALMALLLALFAGALAGWPWVAHHLGWVEPPLPLALEESLERLRDRTERRFEAVEAFQTRLGETDRRIERALDELSELDERLRAAATSDELEALEHEIGDEIAALRRAVAARGERGWRLAEAEHLLRLANHRLQLERDPQRAHRMLVEADNLLAELDDPGLHEVRRAIAAERASLEEVPVIDHEGIYLRLESLKWRMGTLSVQLPEFVGAPREPEEVAPPDALPLEAESLWEQLLARFSRLFELRRHEEPRARPLLGPDEAEMLQMNLRLMLERAQTALLRDDGAIYRASLESTRHWLEAYLDADDPDFATIVAELDELAAIEMAPELPDTSGALARLRDIRARALEVEPEVEPAVEPEVEPAVEPEVEPAVEPEVDSEVEPEPESEPDPQPPEADEADLPEEDAAEETP